MPCHEDSDTSECPVTNWCVCQWAFASYIEKSGGCGNIQTVVCESINQQALIAYQQKSSQYQEALDCLVSRCALETTHLSAALASAPGFRAINGSTLMVVGAVSIMLAGAAAYLLRKRARTLKVAKPSKDYVEAADVKDIPALS